MATTYHNAIQKLYVAYFNRPADFAGLNYWETVVEAAGGDTTAVSAAFAASAEYTAEYDQLTNAGVVTQVYQNLFGHAPDAAGLAFWVNALNTKVMTIDAVVTEIAKGAQGTDKVAYESKVVVATAFTAALDTPAKQVGYSGDLPNDAAKVMLSAVTTAAHAAAAVVPATLSAHVATVIKAGVPFSLTAALNDLVAAEQAKADFLAAADGDDDEDTVALESDLTDAVAVVDAKIAVAAGYDEMVDVSPGVKAAMLADEVKDRNDALVAAQKEFTTATANVAKVPGLAAAIVSVTSATTAAAAAAKAVVTAQGALDGAVATYNTVNDTATKNVTLTVEDDGTASFTTVTTVEGVTTTTTTAAIALTGTPAKLAINPALTAAQKTAVTAVFNASVALEAAEKASAKAADAKIAAQVALDRTDFDADIAGEALQDVADAMKIVKLAEDALPTAAQITTEMSALKAIQAAAQAAVDAAGDNVTEAQTTALTNANTAVTDFTTAVNAFDDVDNLNPLSAALVLKEGAVDDATDAVEDLAELIADLAAAKAVVAEMTALNDAIEAASDVFKENDFAQPITVAGVIGASLGSDIYVAGKNEATIVAFGTSGEDMLFIGTDFTLNRGDIDEDGNNAVLEVFLTQSGADTIISMETATFGSDSAVPEVMTITLTGVAVADVSLANGIITVA